MDRRIAVPYGRGSLEVRIPEERFAWEVAPAKTPPMADLPAAVRGALDAPIGGPRLTELVRRHGTRTMLLVDDDTRPTPQSLILPILLDRLNAAGVPDEEVTVMIGLGTHRPMTTEEIRRRFGDAVVSRVPVENLPQAPEDFEDLGVTETGVPVQVSKRYLETPLTIAVGNIIPHMYAGWAGGAKMIQPAFSSHITTGKTHFLAGQRVYEILGVVDNPIRREMEEIARSTGLKMIVNVVLNRDAEVTAVVAGDPVEAHRAGVSLAEPIYTAEVDERPEIVVAGAHPADKDLWQGFKPMNNCGMLTADGGTLILVIDAPEGIAPDHPTLVRLGTTPAAEVIERVRSGEIADEVGAGTYLAMDRTRSRVNVVLVSDGIDAGQARAIGMEVRRSAELQGVLAAAMERHGPQARVGVVTHGADILGRVRTPVQAAAR